MYEGINPWLKPRGKYDFSAAPTVNDDELVGYSPGSVGVDTTGDEGYLCLDATAGAAVWKPTTFTTSAGLPDPYVPPDGDWDVTGSISATVDVSAASFTGGTYTGTLIDLTQTKLNAASTPPEMVTLTGAAHGDSTPIAASVMATDVLWDFDRTITYATGALAEHSAVIIKAPELAFAGVSTVAKAYTVKIEGPPTAGANATLAAADAMALYCGGNIGLVAGAVVDFRNDGGERIYSDADNVLRIEAGGANTVVISTSAMTVYQDLKLGTGSSYVQGAETKGWQSIFCNHAGLTTTLADGSLGIMVQNTTDALDGARIQNSPTVVWEAQGWKTDATAATMEVQMGMQLQPVTGAAAPTGNLVVFENINDAGYNKLFTFQSGGDLVAEHASGAFKAAGGYCVEGDSATRQHLRIAELHITGTADGTTFTCEVIDALNGEVQASETIDTDSPTGGTRFDTDANGEMCEIKGLSHTVVGVIPGAFDTPDQAADWNWEAINNGGKLKVTAHNSHSGAAIDFSSDVGDGDVIHFHYAYLSST